MRSVGGRNPGGDTLPYHCLSTCPALPYLRTLPTYPNLPTLPYLTYPTQPILLHLPYLPIYRYPIIPYHSLSTFHNSK